MSANFVAVKALQPLVHDSLHYPLGARIVVTAPEAKAMIDAGLAEQAGGDVQRLVELRAKKRVLHETVVYSPGARVTVDPKTAEHLIAAGKAQLYSDEVKQIKLRAVSTVHVGKLEYAAGEIFECDEFSAAALLEQFAAQDPSEPPAIKHVIQSNHMPPPSQPVMPTALARARGEVSDEEENGFAMYRDGERAHI